MEQVEWKGIAEERFRPYKQWVTPSGYLCGTYAAAVFLAYYQDYIDETIIPKAFRRKKQRDLTVVTEMLRVLIQPHGLPTIAWQVSHGLTRFSINSNCLTADVRLLLAAGIERANESMKANR